LIGIRPGRHSSFILPDGNLPNRPDAFGQESHQFSADYLDLNENDPLLSIYNQIQNRQVGGTKSYISELTVETTPDRNFDQGHMSQAVKKAEHEQEQYRKNNGLPPLNEQDRKAQEKQSEELLAWYKLATANPQNIGISLWDGSEKNAWNGNTGGVIDSDYNKKISYFALQDYIQEFKAPNQR
jgi:hypothetical protein